MKYLDENKIFATEKEKEALEIISKGLLELKISGLDFDYMVINNEFDDGDIHNTIFIIDGIINCIETENENKIKNKNRPYSQIPFRRGR